MKTSAAAHGFFKFIKFQMEAAEAHLNFPKDEEKPKVDDAPAKVETPAEKQDDNSNEISERKKNIPEEFNKIRKMDIQE